MKITRQEKLNQRKRFRDKNKSLLKQQRFLYFKKSPWLRHYYNARQRCNDTNHPRYKDYGGRGIKCLITEEEIKTLWFRDKAYLLRQPSINRQDNDGNYTFDNCEFIEKGLNSAERNKRILSKPILQFDLQGNFIKEWKNIDATEKELRIFNIGKVCSNLQKTAGSYIWKFKS